MKKLVCIIAAVIFVGGCANNQKNSATDDQALHYAVEKGDIGKVRSLIAAGADVNYRPSAMFSWNFGSLTPLHVAARRNRTEIAKLLIEKGANVDARSSGADTPLQHAAANEHIDMVKLLLDSGADPNITNIMGWTPLDHAEANGNKAIAVMLREHMAKKGVQK